MLAVGVLDFGVAEADIVAFEPDPFGRVPILVLNHQHEFAAIAEAVLALSRGGAKVADRSQEVALGRVADGDDESGVGFLFGAAFHRAFPLQFGRAGDGAGVLALFGTEFEDSRIMGFDQGHLDRGASTLLLGRIDVMVALDRRPPTRTLLEKRHDIHELLIPHYFVCDLFCRSWTKKRHHRRNSHPVIKRYQATRLHSRNSNSIG